MDIILISMLKRSYPLMSVFHYIDQGIMMFS